MPKIKQSQRLSDARRFTSLHASQFTLSGTRKDLKVPTKPALACLERGEELIARCDAEISRMRRASR